MPTRDPELTARNRIIDGMTEQLRAMLPTVLADTEIRSDQSLHALYGSKFADYIDMKNEVIQSPDHFVSLYLEGFRKHAEDRPGSAHGRNFSLLQATPSLQQYLYVFLKRVYMRNIDALSKRRPGLEDSIIWIGQNNANYGLLITPRFSDRNQQWENDKSEIRHFQPLYWTIGHALQTGLVIPSKKEIMTFASVEDYLAFFVNVLVRNSGSEYEYAIAQMYREYVLSTPEPDRVPLLIPELRYEGFAKKHLYRLDFTIIDPFELSKVAFELSPWSSHGYLSRTKSLSQAQINDLAKDNFEREMRRHKAYFRKYGIFTLIYTDSDLSDLATIFTDMRQFLAPKTSAQQLRFHIIRDILHTN